MTMSLKDVLIDELRDLYSAENQLLKAMPKAAKQIESDELKQIFKQHLEESKGQVERLKQIFGILGKKPTGKHCEGMEGAIKEVQEALEEDEEGALKDAGIIGAGMRVEHYEIAGYTVAIAMAKQLGEKEIAGLLTETLKEETNQAKLVLNAAKKVLKEADEDKDEDKDEDEEDEDSKPKSPKEQESEKESEEDEAEAQEGRAEEAPRAKKDAKKKSKK
jgi:ferritin-like metal-binding protein YciE